MRLHSVVIRAAFVAGIGLAGAGTARATALQTWVSAGGKDSGTCAVTAPCASFKYGIVQTTAGGTISVLTSGSYGPVNITKSLSIVAPEGVQAMIAVTAKNGIPEPSESSFAGVVVSAGFVLLKGLTISLPAYSGSQSIGGIGVFITGSVTALTVDHAVITNGTWGILVNSNSTSNFVLIRSSVINGNEVGIEEDGGNVFLGQNTISGNNEGLRGPFNSYGDNDLNGNKVADLGFNATIKEVSHDQ